MDFSIGTDESLKINDRELSELLTQVYVEGGFTEQELATSLFEASMVRKRGKIIGARENKQSILAGIAINVTPDSPSCQIAKKNEIEMHLLAVKSAYRRNGLGKRLVEASITDAKQEGYSKMILWTQTMMKAAHSLYESAGFVHIAEKDFSRNGRNFRIYERELNI